MKSLGCFPFCRGWTRHDALTAFCSPIASPWPRRPLALHRRIILQGLVSAPRRAATLAAYRDACSLS